MKNWRDKKYTGHTGPMDYQWKNPPNPFNPDFDPEAAVRFKQVTINLQKDPEYTNWTREERKRRFAAEYDRLKKIGK